MEMEMEMESQNCTYFLVLSFYLFHAVFGALVLLFVGGWVQRWVKRDTYVSAMPLLMVLVVCVILSLLFHIICAPDYMAFFMLLTLSFSQVGRIEFMVLVFFFSFSLWLTKGTAHNSLKDCRTKFFDTIIHWFQLSLLSWHVHVRVCVCSSAMVWHFGNSNGTTNLAYAQFIVSLNFATKF